MPAVQPPGLTPEQQALVTLLAGLSIPQLTLAAVYELLRRAGSDGAAVNNSMLIQNEIRFRAGM